MTWLAAVALAIVLQGCGDDDDPAVDGGGGDPDGGVSGDAGDTGDGGEDALCVPDTFPPVPGACMPEADDYAPGADDGWDACVSDDGRYHSVEPTISTVARVMAFEEIGDLLFTPEADPSSDAFLMARAIYQEDEGLDSRIVRRYDPHFDVPEGTDCTMTGVPAMYPDYCAGPARMQPVILDALSAGIDGTDPRANAGRVEAAILWFLGISTYKESLSCTSKAKDCDSSYAYYTGGEPARCGIGLARYVAEVDAYAHDRAWDGLLAVRCWRDLDDAEVATDLTLRDRARAQYDRAVQDGLAAILRDRLGRLEAATGDAQRYWWGFVQVLAIPVLEEMERRSSTAEAASLRAEVERDDPTAIDADAAILAIDAVFECP